MPLGPRQIRVLDFPAPDSSKESDELFFIPRVISLDDHPSFTALSYVWGPPDVPEPGQAVDPSQATKTTHICRLALKTVSQTLGGLKGIFVDAICINQEDESEKRSQIALMGEIYSMATTVHIWLGPGNPNTEQAIELFFRSAGYKDASKSEPKSVLGICCNDYSVFGVQRLVLKHLYYEFTTTSSFGGYPSGPRWVFLSQWLTAEEQS
jgi:hypothetical protein